MTPRESGARVKATDTSLDVLEAVRDLDGVRTTELAAELGVAKSTAHKHLKTLEDRGYLRSDDGVYRVGLKLLNLGEHARTRWPWYSLVQGTVTELHERTEEDVDFVVEANGRVYTICESYHKWEKYPSAKDGYRANLGDRYYMHAVASGKAILATYDEAEVRGVIERWGLPALTENTITDEATLFAELERVREQGYAVGDEEYVAGLRTVSRVVRLPDDEVYGALSVSGPAYRMTGEVLHDEILDAHREAVETLEARIAEDFPANFYESGDTTSSRDASNP